MAFTKIRLIVITCLVAQISGYGEVAFKVNSYSVPPGGQIVVPVTVAGFNNILSIQGTIGFDTTVLSFVDVEHMGLPEMTNGNFGTLQTDTGRLTYSWDDATLAGVSLADSTVIFAIRYNVIGGTGQFSQINFVNAPTPLEVVDSGYSILNPAYTNGLVTIGAISDNITLNADAITSANIYPNPNSGTFIIEVTLPSEQNLSLKIMNPTGQLVMNEEHPSTSGLNKIAMNVAGKAAGNYIVKLQTSKGILTRMVMVE